MIITNLYSLLYKVRKNRIQLCVYRMIKLFLNIYYPFHCKLFRTFKYKNTLSKVMISLTSFPDRIDSVWIVIETLLRQTYKPEKIVLWLAKSQFDSIEILPKKLLDLRGKGLTIKLCEDDLRSHKKYYYAMKYYPDYTIITVDDDTFYPENLVENLVETSICFPNTICCNLGHVLTNSKGMIQPYSEWISGAEGYDQPSDYLFPIGCEGILYPVGSLDKSVFDINQIKNLCPLADDLWLKSMAALNGIKAVKTAPTSIPFANLYTSKVNALNTINAGQKMNDKQLNNIISQYPKLKNIWK